MTSSIPLEQTPSRAGFGDIVSIAICTLCWGTTFYAITLQFGVVDPVVSVVYRFFLAAALLFSWCSFRGEELKLTLPQHGLALCLGAVTFGINYPLVYVAEERVTSAVAAVMFASMAFLNLIAFRLVFAQRAKPMMWFAASLGVVGVAVLSWEEVTNASFGARAMVGVWLLVVAVISAAIGNVFARRIELSGVGVAASTGWAMFYGATLLALFSLATGRAFNFEPTWSYVLSLLHLAVNGSVVAFVLYYGVARRRGYATASYIGAMTPPLAMLVSSLFEAKTWGVLAIAGIAIVLTGQWLLLREKRA